MDFIIITGLSGAGKSRAVCALEDIGFFCVDNIPPMLISKFIDLAVQSEGRLSKIAVVTDIRGGEMFSAVLKEIDSIKKTNLSFKILFLDAEDKVLMRRYKETRRKHPLSDQTKGETIAAIQVERKILAEIRQRADYVIDTSLLSSAQLRERVISLFVGGEKESFVINLISFGFKHGLPPESDLAFDVRCLPNPFYVDELKNKTGLEASVYDFVMSYPQAQGLVPKLFDLLDYLIPLYKEEGKSQLVVSIGCTGGRHRSVVFSEILYKHLFEKGYKVSVNHRDIGK